MYNKIKLRISTAKRDYYTWKTLFKPKLLSRRIRKCLYSCLFHKTWSTTKEDREKMAYFEKSVLRKIYGFILENGIFRRRTNRKV